ncbi:MAG TPA: EAL domain-containing protein [Alphaproteobacteria bacterium]|jgi:EAL domain-containing protein (putative c-di-GMP-specific phosphodiesterase class I)|nr:EAL domain-containing protein [Alphaproteobacteria bacterium]
MPASDPGSENDGKPCAVSQIRDGLAAYEFEPFFQPIVNLADSSLAGFEALARWRHAERGLVEPAEFIQLAEANDLIRAIDAVILDRAWGAFDGALFACARPHPPLLLSVNLSAANLEDSAAIERIEALVANGRSHGVQLQFEITETMLIADLTKAAQMMERLKAVGVSFALDDFGIGYSSLVYLHRLPIDCIKIDRSFSEAILTSQRSRTIVRAIAGLAQAMELRAVAEGVEDKAVADALLGLNCGYGQGLYFGEPVPASGLAACLERGKA